MHFSRIGLSGVIDYPRAATKRTDQIEQRGQPVLAEDLEYRGSCDYPQGKFPEPRVRGECADGRRARKHSQPL